MPDCDMNIYKLEDDWWIVTAFFESEDGRMRWKCDQWEGVVELLEDLRYRRWI
jgi:hypothetical protein